jgi:hypothetical protein
MGIRPGSDLFGVVGKVEILSGTCPVYTSLPLLAGVGYLPNIFATKNMRTAPPKPPPKRRYTSEYPAAAIKG